MRGAFLSHLVLLLVALVGAQEEHTAETGIVAKDADQKVATPLNLPNETTTEPMDDTVNSVRASVSAQSQETNTVQPNGKARRPDKNSLIKSRVNVAELKSGTDIAKAPVPPTRHTKGPVFYEQIAEKPMGTPTNRPMGKSLEKIVMVKGDRAETTEGKPTVMVGKASASASAVHGPGAVQPAVITNQRSTIARPQKVASPTNRNVHVPLRPQPASSAREVVVDVEQGHTKNSVVLPTRRTIATATHPGATFRTRDIVVGHPKAMMALAIPPATPTPAMLGQHPKPIPRVKQHRPESLMKSVVNAVAVEPTAASLIRVQPRPAPRRLIPRTRMNSAIQTAPTAAARHSIASTVEPAVFKEPLNVTPSKQFLIKEKKMVLTAPNNRAQRPLHRQPAVHRVRSQPEVRHQISDVRRVASTPVRPSASSPRVGPAVPRPAFTQHNATAASKQQLDRIAVQSRTEVQKTRVVTTESNTATAPKVVVDEKRLQFTKPMRRLRRPLPTTSPAKASSPPSQPAAVINRPAAPVPARIPASKGYPQRASLPSTTVLGGRPINSQELPVPATKDKVAAYNSIAHVPTKPTKNIEVRKDEKARVAVVTDMRPVVEQRTAEERRLVSPGRASSPPSQTPPIINRPAAPALAKIPASKGYPTRASLPSTTVLGGQPLIPQKLPVTAIEDKLDAPGISNEQVPQWTTTGERRLVTQPAVLLTERPISTGQQTTPEVKTAPLIIPANGTLTGLVESLRKVVEIVNELNKSGSTVNQTSSEQVPMRQTIHTQSSTITSPLQTTKPIQ